MKRCQFCWDIAEILVHEADNDLVDVDGEYQQLYDHAHAQERLMRNPHATEAIRRGDREEANPVVIEHGEMTARGIDLEIVEVVREGSVVGVIVPNRVRINGVDVLGPSGEPVRVEELDVSADGSQPAMVTLTLFVRSLTIKAEE